jgi:hypothetical protein
MKARSGFTDIYLLSLRKTIRIKKMVLRYMVSDTELAKGTAVESGKASVSGKAPKARVEKGGGGGGLRFVVKLLLLATACAFVGMLVYQQQFGMGAKAWVTDILTQKGQVTAIMYHPDNPQAMIDGQVVEEGDTVNGYKVIGIHEDEVELEKNGKTMKRQVHE